MKHPEPAIGSSQLLLLKRLIAAGSGNFMSIQEKHLQRGLDRLYSKGYVRWQASPKDNKTKQWAITEAGQDAVYRRDGI